MSNTGPSLYKKAKLLIPGGTQLLSKRPELFLPDLWPSYYKKAKGVEVWDLDGKKYIDMSINGIGACVLGAADPDVDAAVTAAIKHGSMSTLNCPEEVELAELLLDLHPWADMVRYARGGGEAMAITARILRAQSGKDQIAFCGYHGWHDWYLSANLASDHTLDGHLLPGLEPRGVPRGLQGTMHSFRYNHLEELQKIVNEHGQDLAAIIMEPIRNRYPDKGFLEGVRKIASDLSIPLVFDEVSAAFRLTCGGAHLTLGVEPDIAVFAKGMSNGYPMAAVIGRKEVMHAAEETFISSTYWTERIGPAAAIATIKKFRKHDVHTHLVATGEAVQAGWKKAASDAGLPIAVDGIAPLSHFTVEGEDGNAARTYFTQEMLSRGFLAGTSFYSTFAHTETHIAKYLKATSEVLAEAAQAIADGLIHKKLKGPPAHSGFKRLT